MPTLMIGLFALALTLWLVKSFTGTDPKQLAIVLTRLAQTAGGILSLAAAAFLGVRGELALALPLVGFGLGLLGWPGRELLASMFGRRFAWPGSQDGNASSDTGRRPATSGKMTEQEAYQILGLQPGASLEDIGRAHRALIKKLHPDQGGSNYLAARVNEAKDVLLRRST